MLEWTVRILIAVITVLVIGPPVLKIVREMLRYKQLLNMFPGPKPGWILGSMDEYIVPRERMINVFDKWFKRYSPVFRVWNLTNLQGDVFLADPELMEIVLSSSTHIEKSNFYDRIHSWLGTGLLTSSGSKWHLRRKLITPAFHFKILEDFHHIFVEKSDVMIKKLRNLPEESVVDLMPLISRCTLDIICETAMGTQLNIQEDEEYNDYVTTVYEVNELVIYREFRPWFYPDFIYYRSPAGKRYLQYLQKLHGFTEKVIQERKQQRKTNQQPPKTDTSDDDLPGYKKRLALLDLLLETSETLARPLTDLEIREEVDTFMFEGQDTTAMGITWTLYMLGKHLDIQEAVLNEQKEIFGLTSRCCTLEDLTNMKYLERVIKETLRLYPSVPMIARRIQEELPIGDYIIPAEINLTLSFFHLHRNPEQFPNPEKFDPDNFLPEKTRQRHPFAYLPFSAGPRNCIGQKFAMMELKTTVASIIRNFKIESVEESPDMLLELTLKPKNGLLVKLKSRK